MVLIASNLAHGAVESFALPALQVYGLTAALVAALLLWIYFFFSTETEVTVDEDGIRVMVRSRVGPIRGQQMETLRARWKDLNQVVDVTRHAITSHGSVQKSHHLKFGDSNLGSFELGTMMRDGQYLALIECIREIIGDKLVEKEDLGQLDQAVRKLVDQKLEERGSEEPR